MVIGWLRKQNARQQEKPNDDGDATCTIAVRSSDHGTKARKLDTVRQWIRLRNDGRTHQSHASDTPLKSGAGSAPLTSLVDLPDSVAFVVWQQLSGDCQRALMLVSRDYKALFAACVRSLHLSTDSLKSAGGVEQLGRLHQLFPNLNQLHLHLGPDFDCLVAQQLTRSQLPLLHTLYIDSRLCGETFYAVAKFIVKCPNLRVLRLPNQRCSSAADQRILAAVLEALPALTQLDLGGAVCVSSSGASNAVTPSVMRRITRLRNLVHLSCNASMVPDSNLAALANLAYLESMHISAAGPSTGLSAAVARLRKLTSLELQHQGMTHELVGCVSGLSQLQVLALGLCPKLTDDIMQEVCQLQQLQKLTLPFPLASSHLRLLSRLPHLQELYSWRHIALDILGPAHNPLSTVRQLVCHSIHGRGKELGAWFPQLESLVLKHCSDMAALSLRGCVGLQTLVAGECGQLSDEGFACLRDSRALQRLQVEGATQLTDAAFAAVFGRTMPALQHISLAGCPAITDRGMQLLTGSCRRLANISINSCRQLTDKTLKRLAHCEHLTAVSLRGCRGITAEGVLALAAAPQMKAVAVQGCSGVRSSQCKDHRSGVKVRVEAK